VVNDHRGTALERRRATADHPLFCECDVDDIVPLTPDSYVVGEVTGRTWPLLVAWSTEESFGLLGPHPRPESVEVRCGDARGKWHGVLQEQVACQSEARDEQTK
jgi:hypothetical protein